GTYWIIIQNWAGSTYFEDTWPGPDEPHLFDRVEFTAAIVDDDNDNLTVTPDKTNVATGESFDLDVDWDLSASAPGTYWYGLFDLFGGTGGAVTLGTVDVDIHREPYTVDGEGDFTFPGTAGATVMIDVPEGALGAGEWLAYEPHNVVRAGSDGLHARGFGFELVPYDADGYNPGFDFNGESVTVTIDYSASPALEANAARLMYWDLAGLSWSGDGITVVDRDFENQQLVLEIDHLTEFGLLGVQTSLPVIYR
ncbi:MAG TPA: hypothetical protein VK879_01290, partial [Candidatus Sulfomarinibacteraceae bacterium]|nr:hypothetical protein [Candidatus Sulfomarinibacteraceae bacterium]